MNTSLWILVANASEAKLYETDKLFGIWELVKHFSHPQSREKGSELITDRTGRFENRGPTGVLHGAYEDVTPPKEVEAEKFAILLADELNVGRASNKFSKLVLIAPPHFHGLLNKHCDDQVLHAIAKHIPKDYTKLEAQALMVQLKDQAL